MRYLLAFLLALPLMGQEPAPKAEEKKPEDKKEEKQAAGEQKAAESPAPATERAVTGSVDFGYRFVSDVAGSLQTYRSVVNLGEGPKLFQADLNIVDPSKKLFDRMTLFASGWGGDPYNTTRIDLTKEGVCRFTVDYRNIAYYNFLPSFADPTIGQGVFLNQRAFDIHRRFTNVQLDLRPGRRIVPYLAYTRDSGYGNGVTSFVSDSNEYPVPTEYRDKTDNFRGGVRVEMNRWHLTLEQGGTTFKDDQRAFATQTNPGNRTTPLSGQRLVLNGLNQAYGIRGDSIYSRALFTASPVSWANIYGQFLYSQPKSEAHYSQNNQGLFVVLQSLTFFNAELDQLNGQAKQPRTSGSFGVELKPVRRLRVIESVNTDRLHVSSSALLAERLFLGNAPLTSDQVFSASRFVWNYNRQQVEVLFDLTSKLTLRGGHRFEWGDSNAPASVLSQSGPQESGELRRNVGLAGFSFRPVQKLSANVDYEAASGDRTYFRTSLQNYHKARARARYQLLPSLSLGANLSLLKNDNPAPSIQYDFLSRQTSFSADWRPAGGKRFGLLGEYTRYTLRSDLTYFVPQDLTRERSLYRDNGHLITAMADFNLGGQVHAPKISFGGSLFTSSGSRPARYYQPSGRFLVPLVRYVQWFAEWRYYGFSEFFYNYEGFRTHHFMTGLRLTM